MGEGGGWWCWGCMRGGGVVAGLDEGGGVGEGGGWWCWGWMRGEGW